MKDMSLLESIYASETDDHSVSREQILLYIEREMLEKYPHLSPQFYPSNCMQAKICLKNNIGESLKDNPEQYADILTSEKFIPHRLKHRLSSCDEHDDHLQYILINKELEKIGFKFVLKATFGRNFISMWFRNESSHWRLDLPLFYALEIINKIAERAKSIETQRSASEPYMRQTQDTAESTGAPNSNS